MTEIPIISKEEIIKENYFSKDDTFILIEPEGYNFELYMMGITNVLINTCIKQEDISSGIIIYLPQELLDNVSDYIYKEIEKFDDMNILRLDNDIALSNQEPTIQESDSLKIGDIIVSIRPNNNCKDILITGKIEDLDIMIYDEEGYVVVIYLPIELIKFIIDNLGIIPTMEDDIVSVYLGKNIELRDVLEHEKIKADTKRIGTDEALVHSYFKGDSLYTAREFRRDNSTIYIEGPKSTLMGDIEDYNTIIEGVRGIYILTSIEEGEISSGISINISNQLLNDAAKILIKNLDKNVRGFKLADNIMIRDSMPYLSKETDKLKVGDINVSIGPKPGEYKEILITQEMTSFDLSKTILVVIRNMSDPDVIPEITIYLPTKIIDFISNNLGLKREKIDFLGKVEEIVRLGDIRLKDTSILFQILKY